MDWEEVCRLRQHYCISLLLYWEFFKHKLHEPRLLGKEGWGDIQRVSVRDELVVKVL
jgi:hypothetical protein